MEFFTQIFDFFAELVKNEIFIQCFGFLGTACVLLGMQCKAYNKVLAAKFSNSLFSGLQYLMLGKYTGMTVNLTACGTNVVYWYLAKKKINALAFQIAFGVMFVGLVIWQWQDWTSVFVLIAKVVSTVSLGFSNTKIIRILNLISTPCWLMYNISVGSIAGMCSDILMITSIVTALIRVDIIGERKEKAALAMANVDKKTEEQV